MVTTRVSPTDGGRIPAAAVWLEAAQQQPQFAQTTQKWNEWSCTLGK